MIDSKNISESFAALSHPLRVDILKCLLKNYPVTVQVGQLSTLVGQPQTTVTHHLSIMEKGEIIKRQIDGRSTKISLVLDRLLAIAANLTNACCAVQDNQSKEL